MLLLLKNVAANNRSQQKLTYYSQHEIYTIMEFWYCFRQVFFSMTFRFKLRTKFAISALKTLSLPTSMSGCVRIFDLFAFFSPFSCRFFFLNIIWLIPISFSFRCCWFFFILLLTSDHVYCFGFVKWNEIPTVMYPFEWTVWICCKTIIEKNRHGPKVDIQFVNFANAICLQCLFIWSDRIRIYLYWLSLHVYLIFRVYILKTDSIAKHVQIIHKIWKCNIFYLASGINIPIERKSNTEMFMLC